MASFYVIDHGDTRELALETALVYLWSLEFFKVISIKQTHKVFPIGVYFVARLFLYTVGKSTRNRYLLRKNSK